MAGAGPITSFTLAQRTGTTERYVREWLGNQAAGGYVVYYPADSTYELPAGQAMVVANEDSPVFLGGAFETGVDRTCPGAASIGLAIFAGLINREVSRDLIMPNTCRRYEPYPTSVQVSVISVRVCHCHGE
jgi:hypothetical protein